MLNIESQVNLEQIKILADTNRLAILRHLLVAPASLTRLGHLLGKHPAWIRHHLKKLEAVGLVELAEKREEAGVVEKFYRARAGGYLIQQLVLPEDPMHPVIVFSGSHDLVVESLARELMPHLHLIIMPVGSLDGLMTLRQNFCHIAGSHLLDESGEYNLPYVQHFFPDRNMHVVTLAYREQGFITAAGNPKSIDSLTDLTRTDITFINRNPGSGTRLWLERHLKESGISPQAVKVHNRIAMTHIESAQAVLRGEGDVTLGLHAAAKHFGLDFVHLFNERYDLIFPQQHLDLLMPMFETIQTRSFRRHAGNLTGYDLAHIGEEIHPTESSR